MAVLLKLTHCEDCPFHKVGMGYSLDGWDHGNDWTCTKIEPPKLIQEFVEWRDEVEVPKWCPLPKAKK